VVHENVAQVARPGPREFIPGLAMARGIAALMVALFHSSQAGYFDAAGRAVPLIGATDVLLRALGNGHGAVIFFFVLSGFVLTMMLQRLPPEMAPSARNFFVGRIFRIYPAIVTTLLLFTAVFLLTGRSMTPDSFFPTNIICNALLLRTDIDGVMWSLQVEMLAAPVIFLVYWAWRRIGDAALIIPLVLFAALSFARAWVHLLGPQPELTGIYSFIAGMYACVRGKAVVARAGRSGVFLAIAVVGFAAARPFLGWASNWSVVFETMFASAIVALIAYGTFKWHGGAALAALARYYGRISYSFYLLHPLTLVVLWNMHAQLGTAVDAGVPPELLAIGLFLVSTLMITPVAHLQYALVERAGIAWGRALQGGRDAVVSRPAPERTAP
jgi:peptidoglycan/LPS O-acetylase OafA/YrhL